MKKTTSILSVLLLGNLTYASGGHFEDNFADIVSWIVLIALPIGGVYLFWQAHIYPEVVAEKKNHPQLNAIKTMCLLSLFFGGLLWPVALIWANYNYPEQDGYDDYSSPEEIVDLENESETTSQAS